MERCGPGANIDWIEFSKKKNGMMFIPKEYDLHSNEFHTYGINSANIVVTLCTLLNVLYRKLIMYYVSILPIGYNYQLAICYYCILALSCITVINKQSMTSILSAARSSYRGCEN